MMEPVVERSFTLKAPADAVYLSDSGKLIVAKYKDGYSISNDNGTNYRDSPGVVVNLISDRDIVVVGEGKSLSFFNSMGTLLWKNVYGEEIKSLSFLDGSGVILLKNNVVVLLSGLKNEIGRVGVRDDAYEVKMDSSGRFFMVVGKMGVSLYTTSTLSEVWSQEFMEMISGVALYRGANRSAVSLGTGDFYLLNRNGRRILEYKFSESPLAAFDGYGNVMVAEDGKIKIMNERGTLLKIIETRGRCIDLAASSKSEYVICGTNKGNVYFFNKAGVLWSYEHNESIYSVAITPAGEYVAAANSEVMVFNNLSYYFQVLRNSENKLRSLSAGDPRYGKLADLFKRMKASYLKRDFKMLMSIQKVFDSMYSQIERSNIQYAMVLDSLFFPSQISRNFLYIRSDKEPKILLYGDVRYKLSRMPPRREVRRYLIILQPKRSGEVPIRVDIIVGNNKTSFTTKINADGMPRKKRVISNGDYKKLIA